MSNTIDGCSSTSQYNASAWDGSSVTTVRFGEGTLADVARNRSIDIQTLLAANPQIKSAGTQLTIGQDIALPFCQTPPEAPASSSSVGSPTVFATPAKSGVPHDDPLAKSITQANLKAKSELPTDEQVMKSLYGQKGLAEYQQQKADSKLPDDERAIKAFEGEDGLRQYREIKKEWIDARQSYLTTGKMPALKHFAPIEIAQGKMMNRSERYDANLKRQGKDPSYTESDITVDPTYITAKDAKQEWQDRFLKAFDDCEHSSWRPGPKERCELDLKEKFFGKEYMDNSFAQARAAWNDGAYIESIKNSGPVGLAGRAIGRGVGYLVGGDKGADKGEQWGALFGDAGDLGLAMKQASNARAQVRNYNGSSGLVVDRDTEVSVVDKAGQNASRAETQLNLPATTAPAIAPVTPQPMTAAHDEPVWISHGTDTPSFRAMNGLGTGRIQVDHSPGGHQDFSKGFYVAVDEGKDGFKIAQSAADLRARQRNSGPTQVMAWQMKPSDLGDVVDVRPGGKDADAWKKFLDQPIADGLKMTIGDAVRTTGVEHRGEYFEKFLKSIGKQNADAIIGPLGTPETSGGAASQKGTQMVIRSQRAADRLNARMGEGTGPITPSGSPNSGSKASGTPSLVRGNADEQRSLTRENEAAQILAQHGYRVEQNPPRYDPVHNPNGFHSLSNPDYLVEGLPTDCYSPKAGTSVDSVSLSVNKKVEKLQTTRVVVNLADWNGDVTELKNHFAAHPPANLQDLIVITKDGKVTKWNQ